jgi:hypothetical protein
VATPLGFEPRITPPKCVVLLRRVRQVAILLLFSAALRMSLQEADHHSTASNDVLLHLGHLPVASSVTGRVKCFI